MWLTWRWSCFVDSLCLSVSVMYSFSHAGGEPACSVFFLFFFPHLSESRMSHTYREGAYPHFGFFLGFSLEIGHDSHGRVTLPNNKRPHEMRLGESFV